MLSEVPEVAGRKWFDICQRRVLKKDKFGCSIDILFIGLFADLWL